MSSDFAHYRLGIKYKKEKKFNKAIESFRKVLAVYPDNYNSYYQIAEMRIDEKKYGLAAYELKKALEYKPGWEEAQYLLASCYENNKNYEKALIEWRKFAQLTKEKKAKTEAEEHIEKLIEIIKGRGIITLPELREEFAEFINDKKDLPKDEKGKKKSDKKPSAFDEKAYKDSDYMKGVKAYNAKKYKNALTYFRKAIGKYPGHPGAYYYAGVIRYRDKKIKMAEINFKKGFRFPELGFNGHFYLGLIYEEQNKVKPAIREFRAYKRMTKSAAGKKEAQEHIDRLLAMKDSEKPPVMRPLPTKPYTVKIDEMLSFIIDDTTIGDGRIMMEAINLFRQGKYDQALKKFKSVSIRNPRGILADDAVYNTGICYMMLKLYDNAQNQFDQLSTAFPGTTLLDRGEYLKGICELEKDEFKNAEKLFRKWIRSFPKSPLLPHAYARLGDALTKQDMIKDGIDAYRASLPFFKEEKDKLPVIFAIGENYQNIDNGARAADYFEDIISLRKTVGPSIYVHDAYLKQGDYFYTRNNHKKAMDYYNMMIEMFPESEHQPWARFQTANIYRHRGDYRNAIELYTEIIKNYPDSYWARQARWKKDDTVWQNDYQEVLKQ